MVIKIPMFNSDYVRLGACENIAETILKSQIACQSKRYFLMFEQKQTLSAMPYFQNELLEFDGNNYCVRKKIYKNQEIRFIDSHFIYNSFDASRFSEFMDCCESNRIDAAF